MAKEQTTFTKTFQFWKDTELSRALLENKTEKKDAHGKLSVREPLLPAHPVNWH
ncbi:hypothetical protein KSZ_00290 [Dictyobacter formicarum]|uniref:Uncharacterized protein n=1 Tax=Dictyobacter formicarum TaxID=2778368 RepID=A0ABQ3V9C4_9CHLR|nr:hypothetical protein KSZ_00290 [Dictyobacter formicarum]